MDSLGFEEGWNLEVISPYFDAHGSGPLQQLIGVLKPQETRVYLPRDADGSALVTKEAYNAIDDMPKVRWSELPQQVTDRSGSSESLAPRRVHAKVYRFWRADGEDIVIVGSVNCTSVAHSHGGAGNLEAAFLVDVSELKLPRRWWLRSFEKELDRFVDNVPGESDGLEEQPLRISIKFHWAEGSLSVRLETDELLPIEVTDISGKHLFNIEHGESDCWTVLDKRAADEVRVSLGSSSFVAVRKAETHWRVLVREEGMAYKPSILSELNPEEILEYWSLLSAEERAVFIEYHGAIGEQLEGLPVKSKSEKLGGGDTLFDRFAGVFHAFGCLQRNLEEALKEGRHKDAETLLLGEKYDSLPALLQKLLDQKDYDPVLGYVTFLTAQQIRARLYKEHDQFFEDRTTRVQNLDRLIRKGLKRRSEIFSGDDSQAEAFLNWFEPVFLVNLGSS